MGNNIDSKTQRKVSYVKYSLLHAANKNIPISVNTLFSHLRKL